MIEEIIDELTEMYNIKIDDCRKEREGYKIALIGSTNGNIGSLI